MKKHLLLLGFAMFFCQCSTERFDPENDSNDYVLTRGTEDVFIEETGNRYAIDPDVITVKLKPGVDKIGEDLDPKEAQKGLKKDSRINLKQLFS